MDRLLCAFPKKTSSSLHLSSYKFCQVLQVPRQNCSITTKCSVKDLASIGNQQHNLKCNSRGSCTPFHLLRKNRSLSCSSHYRCLNTLTNSRALLPSMQNQKQLCLITNCPKLCYDNHNSHGKNSFRSCFSQSICSHASETDSHSSFGTKDKVSRLIAFVCSALALLYLSSQDEFSLGLKVGRCTATQCSDKKPESVQKNETKFKSSEKEKATQNKCEAERKREGMISLQEAIEKAQVICERKKEELGTPGLVVCVSVDGRQVYAEGFGYSDLENETPIKPNSVLRIASISKSVTAVIIAKLWETGKVDLDKTVQDYVPNFPQKFFMGEKVDITVHQLLNHTGGIRHYKKKEDPVYAFDEPIKKLVGLVKGASISPFYTVGPVAKKSRSKLKSETPSSEPAKKPGLTPHLTQEEYFINDYYSNVADALKLFQDDALLCKPGSRYNYTTFGFTLLSAIAESAGGSPFTEQVTHTLAHMGLAQSYLDKNGPIIYNRARYYMKNPSGHLVNVPYVDNSYKWAGGGLLSTVEDVVKFGNILLYSAQHEDGDPGPPGYLKASTVWKFWSPPNSAPMPRYGLGFELRPDKQQYGMCGRHTFGAGHTGNAVGASSIVFILPRCTTLDANNRTENSCNPESEKKSSLMKLHCGATLCNKEKGIPQGVVVAIFVNITGVGLRKEATSIARIFEDVDFSL